MSRPVNVRYGSVEVHIIAWLILIILACTGCASRKDKALAYAIENPKDFAGFCGEYYPPKDSVGKPTIVYVPADNKNYQNAIDSLSKAVDSLENRVINDPTDCAKEYKPIVERLSKQIRDLKKDYEPCKPDTAFVNTTVYRTNMGKVIYLEGEVDRLSKALQESKDSNTKKTYWLIGVGFLLVCALVLLIRKR